MKALQTVALTGTALFSACQMMAFVLYPYFAEAAGLTLGNLVSSFSVGSFLFLWGSPYWARRSRRAGTRQVLTVGIMGLLVSQSVLLLLLGTDSLSTRSAASLLWASRILYGLTASAIVPVSQVILAESSQAAGRMKAMTQHSMVLHLGRLFGPFLVWGGFHLGPAAPLWLSVLFLAFLTLLIQFVPDTRGPLQHRTMHSPWDGAYIQQNRLLLGIALMVTVLVGILQSSLTDHVQKQLLQRSQDAAELTLEFLLLASLVTLLIQALMQKFLKNPWQGTLPWGACTLALGCFLLVNVQSEAGLWWALPIFAAGLALLTPSYTAALSLEGQASQQALAAAALAATHTLGYALGGISAAGMMTLNVSPLQLAAWLSLILILASLMVKARSDTPMENLKRDPT